LRGKPFPSRGDAAPVPAVPIARTAPAAGGAGVAGPAVAAGGRTRLWLCLCFPGLPLEAVAGQRDGAPLALLTDDGQRPAVLLCNAAAARRGVRAGLPVNAALALVPGLRLEPRDRVREAAALARLADAGLRFTPLVSVEQDGALLLEVAASAPLFGGLDALHAAVRAQAREAGHAVTTALAPTARGALWLARAGGESRVTEPAALAAVLAPLPVGLAGWPRAARQTLRRMGVARLGECLRLPRDGLARRIGAACLAELDEALGRRPESRAYWRRAERLRDALDLPAETLEAPLLGAALQVLLERLQERLRARQAAARLVWLRLRHRGRAATLLRIGLLRPSAEAAHLHALALLRLETLAIPAPVVAIALEADVTAASAAAGADLLGRLDAGERAAGLVERLRMRLGLAAVHGLRVGREHRPERAWQAVADPVGGSATPGGDVAGAARPLWLVEPPLPLGRRAGGPAFQGPLVLGDGPERIETGWWDGGDVRRDYYVATNPRGLRLWVFRDRQGGEWYLQGLFG
jgi:protein ImuB